MKQELFPNLRFCGDLIQLMAETVSGIILTCWCQTEKAMAPHSSTLAWKIPWTEEPGRLQSMGSLGVRHDWATSLSLFTFHALEKEMATHSSVLAWRIPGTGEPDGLPSVGSHRVRHNWSDLAAAAAADVKRHPVSPLGNGQRWMKNVDQTLLSRSNFPVSLTVSWLPGNQNY